MPKICKYDGCSNPVFGGGYCKYHQSHRTDKKPKRIKQVSSKGMVKRENKKVLIGEDKKFYLEIWIERDNVCYETGEHLGNEPLMTMFHHVLLKSKYPQYRHKKWNIILLKPDIHNQVHLNIDKCPKVKELTERLKEEYG